MTEFYKDPGINNMTNNKTEFQKDRSMIINRSKRYVDKKSKYPNRWFKEI